MDIVERLRSRPNDSHMETERLLDEAADHIEALRDLVARAKTVMPNHLVNWHYSAEIALSAKEKSNETR